MPPGTGGEKGVILGIYVPPDLSFCLGKETTRSAACGVFATSSPERQADLVPIPYGPDRDVSRRDRRDRSRGPVSRRVHLLAVEERVQAQRFAAGSWLDVEDREIDPVAHEALHLVHVAALADPVGEQGLEARAVGPDLPGFARVHDRGIDREGEQAEHSLDERLWERSPARDDLTAHSRLPRCLLEKTVGLER